MNNTTCIMHQNATVYIVHELVALNCICTCTCRSYECIYTCTVPVCNCMCPVVAGLYTIVAVLSSLLGLVALCVSIVLVIVCCSVYRKQRKNQGKVAYLRTIQFTIHIEAILEQSTDLAQTFIC